MENVSAMMSCVFLSNTFLQKTFWSGRGITWQMFKFSVEKWGKLSPVLHDRSSERRSKKYVTLYFWLINFFSSRITNDVILRLFLLFSRGTKKQCVLPSYWACARESSFWLKSVKEQRAVKTRSTKSTAITIWMIFQFWSPLQILSCVLKESRWQGIGARCQI